MPTITKRLENTGIADAGTFEGKWTADADYVLKQVYITRHAGAGFTKSTVTLKIDERPITKDSILCSQLGPDKPTAVEWNQDLREHAIFEYAGTNREGTTIDLSVLLVLEVR